MILKRGNAVLACWLARPAPRGVSIGCAAGASGAEGPPSTTSQAEGRQHQRHRPLVDVVGVAEPLGEHHTGPRIVRWAVARSSCHHPSSTRWKMTTNGSKLCRCLGEVARLDLETVGLDRCTVLVTRGAVFVGSHLVDALVERGDSVRVLDDLFSGYRDNVNSAPEFVAGTVADAGCEIRARGRRDCLSPSRSPRYCAR